MRVGFCLSLAMLVIILSANGLKAQEDSVTQIRIENANTLKYMEKGGREIRKLIGDVRFRQKGIRMRCDSAYQLQNANRIRAYSNVHINQGDTLHLYGEFLRYDGNKRKAVMEEDVKLRETTEDVTLTTDTLYYNMRGERAYYLTGGKIVDSASTLTSEKGYYRTSQKRFAFADSVKLDNPEYVMRSDTLIYKTPTGKAYFHSHTTVTSDSNFLACENGWYSTQTGQARLGEQTYMRSGERQLFTDSLYYRREQEEAWAWRNIRLLDTTENLTLTGNAGYYKEKPNQAILTDSALARQYEGTDTFYLHADTLRSTQDSIGQRVLKAFHGARLYHDEIQAQADSMVYHRQDSLIYLYNKPVMWYQNYQLTGEVMRIKTDGNGNIKRLIIPSKAFIIDREREQLYNQVKGERLTGFFKDNELKRILIVGSSKAIYFPKDKSDHYVGINEIKSSKIRVYFEEQEIQSIHFVNEPDATIHPIGSSDPQEFRLPGFAWLAGIRPQVISDLFLPVNLKTTSANDQSP